MATLTRVARDVTRRNADTVKRNDTPRPGLSHYIGKGISGANYRPSCGACTVPPWEVCACSAMMSGLPETQSERFNIEADERLRMLLAA